MPDDGPTPDVPSLEIVERALAEEAGSYRFRAGGVDTKAGLVLGAAGVLVTLIGPSPGVAGLVGQVLGLASGAAAVRALFPRVDKSIGVRRLRDKYLGEQPLSTRLILLNTRIDLQERDEHVLLGKFTWLKRSAALLLSASAAQVVGAIVELG